MLPTSLIITQLEITTLRHTIIPASGYTNPVIGKCVLIVDYNAVTLARSSFLLSPDQKPPIFDRA